MNKTKSKLIVTAISALALASVVSTAEASTAPASTPAQHFAVTVDSQGRSFVGGLDIAKYLTAEQVSSAKELVKPLINGLVCSNKCQPK